MLNKIKQILQPAKNAGRLLFTQWTSQEALSKLAAFAEALNCQAAIVTPDKQIARAAAALEMVAVTGDFLSSVEGSLSQFSLVVVPGNTISPNAHSPNFPEWQHVLNSGPYLRAEGVLAFIVDRKKMIHNKRALITLLQAYRNLRTFRLENDTLLVIGSRRSVRARSSAAAFSSLVDALNANDVVDVPEDCLYPIPDMRENKQMRFRSKHFDPALMEKSAAKLPWGIKTLNTALRGWVLPPLEPVMPLRAMHLGAAISSGALGSLRVKSAVDGHEYVIRGRTVRRVRETQKEQTESEPSLLPETGHQVQEIKTGDFITDISLLDLDDAAIRRVDPLKSAEMQAFLEEFGETLAKKAAQNYAPLYDPREAGYPEILRTELVRAIDAPLNWTAGKVVNISGTELPSLTARQRHFVAAAFLRLVGKDAVSPELKPRYPAGQRRLILSGQTAVGKTMLSHRIQLGLQLLEAQRTGRQLGDGHWPIAMFVATPANVPHVKKEIKFAAPLFDVREVRAREDLLQALDDVPYNPRPIMIVIARTILRQMQALEPAFNWGFPRFRLEDEETIPNLKCPTCGGRIDVTKSDARKWEEHGASFLTANSRIRSRGQKCKFCHSPLFQETHQGTYSLAQTLRRELKKRRIDLLSLVIDELHEDANLTNQGAAMGWITDLASYVVGMSGTVYGGSPETVFYLLYRLLPTFRQDWAFSECSQFCRQYGNWRQSKNGLGQWGKRYSLPGISPELIAGVFLNYATFLTQADAGLPMPDRHDIPIELSPSKAEKEGLNQAARDFKARVIAEGESSKRRIQAAGPAAQLLYAAPVGFHLRRLAPFSPAYVCQKCGKRKVGDTDKCQHVWLQDQDELEEMAPEERERLLPLIAEPVLDSTWRATKELALIAFIERERAEGRIPLVYLYHTGTYEIDRRVEFVLAEAGLKALNVKKMAVKKVEKAINSAQYNGYDAVLANPAKVGTGLNLIGTPSIYWYQPCWSPKLKIQASARSDRPTQPNHVRVFYPVVQGAAESVVLARAMEKIISIYLLAGVDYEGLSSVMETVGHEETFTEAMIRFVSSHVETDLSTMFEQLAKIDTGRTEKYEIAVYQANQETKKIDPILLENAAQLALL